MAEAPAPLFNLADQVLINALAAILLPVLHEVKREQMFVAVLAEVLPGTNEENPQMRPLIEAAKGFFDRTRYSEVPRDQAAKALTIEPLAQFFAHRAGVALEALRAAKLEAANEK